MKKNNFEKAYWEKRYQDDSTQWDLGEVTTPIKEYVDQLEDKTLKILIPGAGRGYEAEYLINQGFNNTFVIDIVEQPLLDLKKRVPEIKSSQLINSDFFFFEDKFDIIFEHTFFCALDPSLRNSYVTKMHSLLKPKGKLVGLLFNFELKGETPPFGGSKTNYITLFESHFKIKTLSRSYNSVKSRADKELFFIFEKKGDELK